MLAQVAQTLTVAIALQASSAPPPSASDALLARIREALAKGPPRLRITTPEPTYRVEIREHPYFRDLPMTWSFAGGGVPTTERRVDGSTPVISVGVPIGGGGDAGVLPMLRALRAKLGEHAAREEVSRAIAEFCATHACVRE
jgi:hypothetical protein